MPARASLTIHAALLLFCVSAAQAQAQAQAKVQAHALALAPSPSLSLTLSGEHSLSIDAGETLSAGFAVANGTSVLTTLVPTVLAPNGWTVVTGSAHLSLAPRGFDVWVVAIKVPGDAAAGSYRVGVSLRSGNEERRDSLDVMVKVRTRLILSATKRPLYAIDGRSYTETVLLRNAGNTAATVVVSARTGNGTASVIGLAKMQVAAQSGTSIVVHVVPANDASAGGEQVTTVDAQDVVDTMSVASLSIQVPVVARPALLGEQFHYVNAALNIRATAMGDIAAPVELRGGGALRDDGDERIDFYCRGPVRQQSRLGERDDCRLSLKATNYQLRVGDEAYEISPLTSTSRPGFGSAIDVSRGSFRAGAFGDHFRWNPNGGHEVGSYIAWAPAFDSHASLALNLVDRSLETISGRLASVRGTGRLGSLGIADGEYALSSGYGNSGSASSGHITGEGSRARYELGYQRASPAFAGVQRGVLYGYASGQASLSKVLGIILSASSSSIDRRERIPTLLQLEAPAYRSMQGPEDLTIVTVGTSIFDRFNVDYVETTRRQREISDGEQSHHGLRLSVAQQFNALLFSGEFERGDSRNLVTGVGRTYNRLRLSPRFSLPAGSIGAYYSRDDGQSAIGEDAGYRAIGMDAALRLPGRNDVTLNMLRSARNDNGSNISQLDAKISHAFLNGQSVGLRARLLDAGATTIPARQEKAVYLEYGIPMRVPVSPRRTLGQVRGRVVDAVSGRGIPGALVAVGGKTGLTDRNGMVSVSGVAAGEHQLVIGGDNSSAGSVLSGDSRVTVGLDQRHPVTFRVATVEGALVRVAVLRRTSAGSSLAAVAADSTIEVALSYPIVVRLAAARDTLYQTTSEQGIADFGSIAPGRWTLSVIPGELPPFEDFDKRVMELDLRSGQTVNPQFHLAPVRREIRLFGNPQNEQTSPTVETLVVHRQQK